MIRTKAEIMDIIKAKIGDSTEDADLALLEDITDTLDDYDKRISESGDWKTKYEENDKSWRQKYKDRFSNPDVDKQLEKEKEKEEQREKDETPKKLTFDALFETKEENNNG